MRNWHSLLKNKRSKQKASCSKNETNSTVYKIDDSLTLFCLDEILLRLTFFLFTVFWFITRPNCALDKHTILCLHVPGFQIQVLEHVRILSERSCRNDFVGKGASLLRKPILLEWFCRKGSVLVEKVANNS